MDSTVVIELEKFNAVEVEKSVMDQMFNCPYVCICIMFNCPKQIVTKNVFNSVLCIAASYMFNLCILYSFPCNTGCCDAAVS